MKLNKKLGIVTQEKLNGDGEKVATLWLGDEQICVTCHGEEFPHIHTNVDVDEEKIAA